ncbi:MAG TPA: YceI family protein, partial [Casimicrobiaceae bacterium]|nr:YceI family protein [Casimicrobiaceae bacterium]
DHLGLSMVSGRFDKTTGKVTLDRDAKTGSVDIAVPTATVTTGDADKGSRPRSRDEHLRTADFFNVAKFPQMTFKSNKVHFAGDNPSSVEGDLTLLGVTKPLTLTIVRFQVQPGVRKQQGKMRRRRDRQVQAHRFRHEDRSTQRQRRSHADDRLRRQQGLSSSSRRWKPG